MELETHYGLVMKGVVNESWHNDKKIYGDKVSFST